MPFELNYDEAIVLDAEDLAEGGIQGAYEDLLPRLSEFVAEPISVEDHFADQDTRYWVTAGNQEYVIYSPDLEDGEGQSWGRATFALFRIVNGQLSDSEVRFYAINGGNDLFGMFLAPADAERAKAALPKKSDWPYLPTPEHPGYGQFY